jgi:paraquat-inducible protein B
VTELNLSRDQQYAVVKVKLRRRAEGIAREGSTFWVVRPRLDAGSITGLGTIISGPHITVSPGNGKPANKFTGAENSPTTVDPRGLKVVLLSPEGGSLRAGVPIYYRGVEVGAVQQTLLSTNARMVEIHAIVKERYAPLVRIESKFWNVTGLDVRFGLFRGAEINVESLKSLVIGGIAFATPDDFSNRPVANGAIFRLHEQGDKAWLQWSPNITIQPEPSPDIADELNTSATALQPRLP